MSLSRPILLWTCVPLWICIIPLHKRVYVTVGIHKLTCGNTNFQDMMRSAVLHDHS